MRLTARRDGEIVACEPSETIGIQPSAWVGQSLKAILGDRIFADLLNCLTQLQQVEYEVMLPRVGRAVFSWLMMDDLIEGTCLQVVTQPESIHRAVIDRLRNDPELRNVLKDFVLDLGMKPAASADDLGCQVLRVLQNQDQSMDGLLQTMPQLVRKASTMLNLQEVVISAKSPNKKSLIYPTVDYMNFVDLGLETPMDSAVLVDALGRNVATLASHESVLADFTPTLESIPGLVYIHDEQFRYLQFRGDTRRLNQQPQTFLGQPVDLPQLDRAIAEPRMKALEEARRLRRRVEYRYEHYWNERWWYFLGAALPFPSVHSNLFATQIQDADSKQTDWWETQFR